MELTDLPFSGLIKQVACNKSSVWNIEVKLTLKKQPIHSK